MNSVEYALNLVGSLTATGLRAGVGIITQGARTQPAQLLELYEFEGCPHCRLVREVLTELDLDALIYPCPKGGRRFRPRVEARGGKAQFPYLVDPNNGVALYESADIIAYLFKTYGPGSPSLAWRFIELQRIGSIAATAVTLSRGSRARSSSAPEYPLELFSFESSPFARPVRETLCELELPYQLRSVGRAGAGDWVPPAIRRATQMEATPSTRNRQRLKDIAGTVSVPYLVDPNTGQAMAESAEIVKYLESTYAG
ncbi:MAG: glutathione S-transferase N-terminal domain-containing protein [Pseudomonadota bacterium]